MFFKQFGLECGYHLAQLVNDCFCLLSLSILGVQLRSKLWRGGEWGRGEKGRKRERRGGRGGEGIAREEGGERERIGGRGEGRGGKKGEGNKHIGRQGGTCS